MLSNSHKLWQHTNIASLSTFNYTFSEVNSFDELQNVPISNEGVYSSKSHFNPLVIALI